MTTRTLAEWICREAREVGFHRAGIARVEPMNPAPLRAWLEAGYGAEMTYLRRHLPLRGDLNALLPGAKSVISVALAYPGPTPGESGHGGVARYARGADYHVVVEEMLAELWGRIAARHPEVESRIFVDAGPLPERELARRAGIGWPGKHGCLIAPGLGTRFVLGELLTTLPIEASRPAEGACGDCRRCLDACPTGALIAPGILDARRCLSHLTIEHRGPIPRALRPLVGTRLFGCDACQDACPHNAAAGEAATPLAPAPDLLAPDLCRLLSMSPEAFRARFRHTALYRATRDGLLRNACVALGNADDAEAVTALRQALRDASPLVRGHAAWALGRLGDVDGLTAALHAENDSGVREEIRCAFAEINGRPA